MSGFQYRYRKPRNTPQERGGRKPCYSRTLEHLLVPVMPEA